MENTELRRDFRGSIQHITKATRGKKGSLHSRPLIETCTPCPWQKVDVVTLDLDSMQSLEMEAVHVGVIFLYVTQHLNCGSRVIHLQLGYSEMTFTRLFSESLFSAVPNRPLCIHVAFTHSLYLVGVTGKWLLHRKLHTLVSCFHFSIHWHSFALTTPIETFLFQSISKYLSLCLFCFNK